MGLALHFASWRAGSFDASPLLFRPPPNRFPVFVASLARSIKRTTLFHSYPASLSKILPAQRPFLTPLRLVALSSPRNSRARPLLPPSLPPNQLLPSHDAFPLPLPGVLRPRGNCSCVGSTPFPFPGVEKRERKETKRADLSPVRWQRLNRWDKEFVPPSSPASFSVRSSKLTFPLVCSCGSQGSRNLRHRLRPRTS